MKGILEYFKIEKVSHPATSDIQIGMNIDEKTSSYISELVSNVFENEIVIFYCNYNGINSDITVISESKKLQLIKENNKFNYKIVDSENILLESVKTNFTSVRDFKIKIKEYGDKKGWIK